MATRLRTMHQEDVRAKIKTSQLINRLSDHALGAVDLSVTQIRAIEILLRKSLSDLTSIQLSGPDGGAVEITAVERRLVQVPLKLVSDASA